MEDVEIVTLKPEEWQHYRDLRLRALKEEPQAFSSTYESSVKHSDSLWMERLKDAEAEKAQWMVFAKRDDTLVGMATAFAEKERDTAHVGAVYQLQMNLLQTSYKSLL